MVAIGVIACVAFVVSYSSRILLGLRAEAELKQVERQLEALQAEQETIRGLIAQSPNDETQVEIYARDEQNWIKPGDQAVIPIPSGRAEAAAPAPLTPPAAGPAPSHWREWWQLIAPGP